MHAFSVILLDIVFGGILLAGLCYAIRDAVLHLRRPRRRREPALPPLEVILEVDTVPCEAKFVNALQGTDDLARELRRRNHARLTRWLNDEPFEHFEYGSRVVPMRNPYDWAREMTDG